MNLEMIQKSKIRSVLQFSIPAIIAMVLTSVINVTDGFFIGNYVGKEGIAAMNLGLPLIYLYLATGLMVSVGGVAIAGIALGAREFDQCTQVFNQTISTVTVISFGLSLIVWIFFKPMLAFMNASDQVARLFTDYYGIMLLELPIMVITSSFGMFIRGEGKPQYFMQVNLVNVLLNILLDYLFVARFGFGVKGAAISSLIAALVTLMLVLLYFHKKSEIFRFGRFSFSGKVLKSTILNGSSEFIGEMTLSISMFAYNFVIMKQIGVDGVTAFTIVGYAAYVFSMIVIGFGQGLSPLVSFVYGAKQSRLAGSLRRHTAILVFGSGIVLFLLLFLGSEWYSRLFVSNPAVTEMVRTGIPVFAVSFLFSGYNTISSFYFTSIGKALESAVISFARGLVLLLVCIFTLPFFLGIMGVWLVAPVTELLTLFISLLFVAGDRRP